MQMKRTRRFRRLFAGAGWLVEAIIFCKLSVIFYQLIFLRENARASVRKRF